MALDQLSDPPLDSLQRINVFPMLGSTNLDIISQIWPHSGKQKEAITFWCKILILIMKVQGVNDVGIQGYFSRHLHPNL